MDGFFFAPTAAWDWYSTMQVGFLGCDDVMKVVRMFDYSLFFTRFSS